MNSHTKSFQLPKITSRVMRKNNWDADFAKSVETEYIRFLSIHRNRPNAKIVPSELVDQMWHEHILHTKDYHDLCHEMFGHYLHHFPTEEGKSQSIDDTFEIYRDLFESEPPSNIWKRDGNCMGNCTGSCGGGGCSGGGACANVNY